MIAGLRIEYWLVEEPAKIRVKAWNENMSGATECYINFDRLEDFSSRLKDFMPSENSELSCGDKSESSSYFRVSIQSSNSLGHLIVTINMANGDYEPFRSEVTIRFGTDASSLDSFANSLASAIENQEGTALLAGIK